MTKNKYIICVLTSFLFSVASVLAQQPTWEIMEDVKITQKEDNSGYPMDVPVFGSNIKKLEKQKVQLKGYIIPLKELLRPNYFVLSRYPFNLCYFCGAAGPESVIEVFTNKNIPYTEKPVVIEGTFYLNEADPDHLMYILKDARIIETN